MTKTKKLAGGDPSVSFSFINLLFGKPNIVDIGGKIIPPLLWR